MRWHALLTLITPALLAAPNAASAQAAGFDSFDDGNDAGWSRLDPLAEAGASAGSFTFPGGGYRLMRSPSPTPEEAGVARLGSHRPDLTQTGDFFVRVDVTGWDDAEDQNIGLLAMISDPGLGTTIAYALSLDTSEQALYLSLIDFEAPSTVANQPLEASVTPENGFRLIFQRRNGELHGSIFALSNLDTALATVEGFDDFLENGSPGCFTSAEPADGAIDATFDNFSILPDDHVEDPPVTIVDAAFSDDAFQVHFSPLQENATHVLESSTDLVNWMERADQFEHTDGSGIFKISGNEHGSYFRVVRRRQN